MFILSASSLLVAFARFISEIPIHFSGVLYCISNSI